MNVTLRPELEQAIADDVRAGRSAGADDFLNKAVYHYVLARDLGQTYTTEEMDRLIDEGLADEQWTDGEDAFRQLRAYAASQSPKN